MNYLIAILFFVSPFVAATTWYENGEPVENVSVQGSKGDFGAIILMTTDSKKVLENWSMPSAGVHILTAEKVEKGKPIEALVLFGGCTANDLGHCVSEVDYKIVKSDGSI